MPTEKPLDRIRKNIEHYKAASDWHKAAREYEVLLDFIPDEAGLHKQYAEVLLLTNNTIAAINEFLTAARLEEEAQHYEKAIALIKKVLKLKPTLRDLNVKLGDLYACYGKIKEAIVYYELASHYFKEMNDSDQVIGIYRKICDVKPENIKAHLDLVDLYEKEGHIAQTVTELQQLLKIVRETGLGHEVEGILVKIVRLDPANLDVACDLVEHYMQNNAPDKALAEIKQILVNAPEFTRGYRMLGEVLTQRGDIGRAIKAYRKYLVRNPKSCNVLIRMISLLMQRGQINEALHYCIDLAQLVGNETDKQYLRDFIAVFQTLDRNDVALQELFISLLHFSGLKPVSEIELEKLIRLYHHSNDRDRAIALHDHLKKGAPFEQYSRLFHNQDDLQRDEDELTAFIADYNPFNSATIPSHHQLINATKQYDAIVGTHWKPPAKKRNRLRSLDVLEIHLGAALYDLGCFQAAIRQFQNAATQKNLASEAYAWIGTCYNALGHHSQANSYLKRVKDNAGIASISDEIVIDD